MRRLLIALILILSAALCATACAKKDGAAGGQASAAGGGEKKEGGGGGAPQGPPPVPVVVNPAVMQPYAPALELIGDIRATQRAMLAAEVSGRVTKIAHRVGEQAPKGQALITIDPATYSASLASAQANLEQARQAFQLAQAGPRTEQIGAQESALRAAQARYDAAADNLQRQEQLFAEGVISEATLVAARSSAEAARAAVEQEQRRLDELNAGSRPEELSAAQARIDAAVAAVELARLSLQRTTVSPPFTSVVSQLLVEVGQYVGPGTPLAEVVAAGQGDDIAVEAWFNLPEAQARQVNEGDRVELRTDAVMVDDKPAVFQGRVISVAPAADPVTRQFPVRVSVTDRRLRPGMNVRARVLTADPVPTLMVDADSTAQTTLGLVVYRMLPPAGEGELPSVEPVPVELGENVDDFIVIESQELKAGDMIVSRGKEQLYPGAKIIPTNLQQGGGAPGGAPGGPPPEGGAAEQGGAAGASEGAGEGGGGEAAPEQSGAGSGN
jgi:HlyD family secretion protein